MKMFVTLLLVASALAATETRWNLPSDEGISVLSDSSFQDFVATHKYVMVMFTSPECPHCKKAHPEYVKVAKKFDDEKLDAVIAELDVVANPQTAAKFGVSAYPTFKYFFHGIPIDYHHDRSEKHMSAWLTHKMKDRAVEITKMSVFKKLSEQKVSVVLYLAKKNKKLLTQFQALAASFHRIHFGYTYLDEVQADLKLESDSAMIVFRSFDDGRKILSNDELTYDSMHRFLDAVRMPVVPDLTQENAGDVFGKNKGCVLLFGDSEETPEFKAFNKVAHSKKYDMRFAKASIKEGFGKKIAELMGVSEEHLNQVRILKFGEGQAEKYRLESVTEESLIKFMDDFKAGKLSTYLKSEHPHGQQKKGQVWHVTSQDFEKLVLTSPDNVLLMVYSHDCVHCHELSPILDKLATRLASIPDLIIAKFNGYKNEHPSINVHAYPTLRLFKQGKKFETVDFRGTKKFKEITDFLKRELGPQFHVPLNLDDDSL